VFHHPAKAMIFHVARAGEVIGEFSESAFQEKVFAGEIRPEDHYWTEGLADWRPVSQYRIAAKTVRMSPVLPPIAAKSETQLESVRSRQPRSDNKLCSNCGYVGPPRAVSRWRLFVRSATCPKCGSPNMIPVNSLVAQRFLER
jgi:predicted RNA-binding Zn-ribbon protein involved in translation (DUF1610 family)